MVLTAVESIPHNMAFLTGLLALQLQKMIWGQQLWKIGVSLQQRSGDFLAAIQIHASGCHAWVLMLQEWK